MIHVRTASCLLLQGCTSGPAAGRSQQMLWLSAPIGVASAAEPPSLRSHPSPGPERGRWKGLATWAQSRTSHLGPSGRALLGAGQGCSFPPTSSCCLAFSFHGRGSLMAALHFKPLYTCSHRAWSVMLGLGIGWRCLCWLTGTQVGSGSPVTSKSQSLTSWG